MEKFVSNRITDLRKQKGVSEYRMSFELGHSRGYINNISSGKAMPSMSEFFAICEYFGTTPQDFFNTRLEQPQLLKKLCDGAEKLSAKDQTLVLDMIQRLAQNG